MVELGAFNALSPPVRQPRRWFRLAPRTLLGRRGTAAGFTHRLAALLCGTPERASSLMLWQLRQLGDIRRNPPRSSRVRSAPCPDTFEARDKQVARNYLIGGQIITRPQ